MWKGKVSITEREGDRAKGNVEEMYKKRNFEEGLTGRVGDSTSTIPASLRGTTHFLQRFTSVQVCIYTHACETFSHTSAYIV